MRYELAFVESALKEWKKLPSPIRAQMKDKLGERLHNPRVPSARLHGMPNCYKIKLRTAGYRLVYQVDDGVLLVTVIAVGRRDRNVVYANAEKRL